MLHGLMWLLLPLSGAVKRKLAAFVSQCCRERAASAVVSLGKTLWIMYPVGCSDYGNCARSSGGPELDLKSKFLYD